MSTNISSVWDDIVNWFKKLIGGGEGFDNFPDPKLFFGYGLVNNWSAQNASDYMNKLAKNKVPCIAFEFFEWARPDRFKNVDKQLDKFKKYLDIAKDKKMMLYVTLVNANTGSGKYGDPRIPLSKYDAQIKKAADQFAEWMKSNPNLFITPVGEGDSSYDRSIQEYCKARMPKAQLVNNWESRPTSSDGCQHTCQHPSSTSYKIPRHDWSMSDHSKIIDELNKGGLYGTCDYEATKKYAIKMRKSGHPFIYYHFNKDGKIDSEALRALKDSY